MNELQAIQAWFQEQCNGEWEHSEGIRIESCDNPGWWVRIGLKGTRLADKHFAPRSTGLSDDRMETDSDWLHCEVKDHVFDAAGDPSKLEAILRIFLEWAKTD
jgi:hypothetical protein